MRFLRETAAGNVLLAWSFVLALGGRVLSPLVVASVVMALVIQVRALYRVYRRSR